MTAERSSPEQGSKLLHVADALDVPEPRLSPRTQAKWQKIIRETDIVLE